MIQSEPRVTVEQKSIHKKPITGIHCSQGDPSLVLTISEDRTMRLFDLRLNSSVKLFVFPDLDGEGQTANCLLSEASAFGVVDNRVFSFDLRNEIIIKDFAVALEAEAEVNQISFNETGSLLLLNCDSGNSYIYDKGLTLQHKLLDGHKTVCYTGSFITDDEESQLCLTAGFDYSILLWKYGEQVQLQCKTDLSKIHAKYSGIEVTPPVIYSLSTKNQSVLVSTETGQVYNFPLKELKKKKNKKPPVPEYVIDAHNTKVIRSIFLQNPSEVLTISNDKTFALWRKDKQLECVAIPEKPNWVEMSEPNRKIFVGDVTNKFYIYSI